MKKSMCFITAVILAVTMLLPAAFTVGAASTDVLKGKSVLVTGDDISAGWSDVSRGYGGWGRRLKDDFGMEANLVHASSGVSISDWRKGYSGVIHGQVSGRNEKSFDYILLHGGMADAEKDNNKSADATEGVVTGAVKPNDFTIPDKPESEKATTFAAGVERLILTTIKKYNGARIGFIINYATPNNSCENARNMDKYWEVARQVCDKWGIPYLDLYAGKAPDGKSYSYDILDMDNPNSPNHNNNKHLKAAGYDAITPYIAQWMTTIQPYNLEATLATAPTTTRKTGKTLATPTATTTTTGKSPTTGTTTVGTGDAVTTTTAKDKDSSNAISAGEGEIVTRKTTTTASSQPAAADSDGPNGTVMLVLIICAAVVVLVVAAVVTVLIIRSRKK